MGVADSQKVNGMATCGNKSTKIIATDAANGAEARQQASLPVNNTLNRCIWLLYSYANAEHFGRGQGKPKVQISGSGLVFLSTKFFQ